MKVLLLPVNLASDISHKVRSLRKLGIEARGFSIAPSYIQSGENITVFDLNRGSQLEIRARKLFAYTQMWRMIALADVLHWVGEPVVFESVVNKSLLKWFDKPGVIQWMGSDIRIPEMDFDVNPYYRKVFGKGYEYTSENKERSLRTENF